ncbi:hypothetical protein D0Z03_001979 [Geotrichum reessii]|nr:hypothetical protein D0Z03_001979 [Galactomyces reessii]
MRRVVVTGLGVVSPLGVGVNHVWKALIAGESGIVSLKDTVLKNNPDIPATVGGAVPLGPGADGKWDSAEWVDKTVARRIPLFAQYALSAAQQALNDAAWRPESTCDQEQTGVCVGSGIGGFEDVYQNVTSFNAGGYRKVSPLFIPRLLNNMAAGHISITHKLKGPNHSASTACTTGAHSIGDAANFIRSGLASVMVAGSAEATLHPLAFAGFARAKSLSTNPDPALASRPFDSQRGGFVMGEGSGVLVLEELEHALARKAPRIYAELVGYGLSGDAHHITAPPDDGDGAYRAMKMALRVAGVEPVSVGYINAHATSTRLGDIAENSAIVRLLCGDAATREAGITYKADPSEIYVSSTKGAIGHLLGAAGSVEALFTVKALASGMLPPTAHLTTPEEGLQCNYIPNKGIARQVDYALTNSFGFGGTNASLLFKRFEL